MPASRQSYYEKGNGKDLGSVLEFKSEIKLGLEIFENSKIGYSYSHISNNDWGELKSWNRQSTNHIFERFF